MRQRKRRKADLRYDPALADWAAPRRNTFLIALGIAAAVMIASGFNSISIVFTLLCLALVVISIRSENGKPLPVPVIAVFGWFSSFLEDEHKNNIEYKKNKDKANKIGVIRIEDESDQTSDQTWKRESEEDDHWSV